MKKIMLLVFLILLTGFVFSAKIGTLPGVLKPDSIYIYGDEFYVMEGPVISIFSLKDLSLIKKFGKSGEGPGEIQAGQFFINKVTVFKDYILAESLHKIIFFSKKGALIKEVRKPQQVDYMLPVGKNFVARKTDFLQKGKMETVIALYDPDMKKIKELHRQKGIQEGLGPKIKMDMVMDFANFKVSNGRVFVEKSTEGFVIDVYDGEGKRLYRVKRDYEKMKVGDEYKTYIVNRFKEDPRIKKQTELMGGWEQVKKVFTMNFADFFPAVQDFDIYGEKLYIQTFKVVNGKEEFVVTDLKGGFIKRVFIRKFENVPLMNKIRGAKLNTIGSDKLYYLLENEDEEEWELHMEAL